MPLEVRLTQSDREREQVFRLRYDVYIREMNVPMRYADHERRRIEEPLDRDALLLAVFDGNDVVGTCRVNLGSRGDLREYVQLHHMHEFGEYFPDRVSVSTRFVMTAAARGGGDWRKVVLETYRLALEGGSEFDFSDGRVGRSAWMIRAGYRQVFAAMRHPDDADGLHVPTVLVVRDYDYLQRVGSPYTELLPANPPGETPEAVKFFYSRFPDAAARPTSRRAMRKQQEHS